MCTSPEIASAERFPAVTSTGERSPIPLAAVKLTTPPVTSTSASAAADSLIAPAETTDTVSSKAVTRSTVTEPLDTVLNDTLRPAPPAVTRPACRSPPVFDREIAPSVVLANRTATSPPPVWSSTIAPAPVVRESTVPDVDDT